jgi:hypothetical protein
VQELFALIRYEGDCGRLGQGCRMGMAELLLLLVYTAFSMDTQIGGVAGSRSSLPIWHGRSLRFDFTYMCRVQTTFVISWTRHMYDRWGCAILMPCQMGSVFLGPTILIL